MNRFQGISCNKFQKIAFYRLVYLYEILSIFIKSPDFSEITDIQEIKELSDFSQFSKESLIPFGVLIL